MQQHDAHDTLHFVDPPYIHRSRVLKNSKGAGYYRHEMDDQQHMDLIEVVKSLKGMVILCGYPNKLYDGLLVGFETHTTQARIAGQRGAKMRTEQIWLNPSCANRVEQQRLFA